MVFVRSYIIVCSRKLLACFHIASVCSHVNVVFFYSVAKMAPVRSHIVSVCSLHIVSVCSHSIRVFSNVISVFSYGIFV